MQPLAGRGVQGARVSAQVGHVGKPATALLAAIRPLAAVSARVSAPHGAVHAFAAYLTHGALPVSRLSGARLRCHRTDLISENLGNEVVAGLTGGD